MTQDLKCTKCNETIVYLVNPVEEAVCDIFAYHHIQHAREEALREAIKALREMACEKCQNGYGVTDESGEHRSRCMPAITASYMLVSKYFATEVD